MPKYYCSSGEFQAILTASCPDDAGRKALSKLMQADLTSTVIMKISEIGFANHPPGEDTFRSLVPFMREVGIKLPPDEVIVQNICQLLGVSFIDERTKRELLYGE